MHRMPNGAGRVGSALLNAFICLTFLLTGAAGVDAQRYKGEPVRKDRLAKALRSKQLRIEDIITVVRSNGVDFALTPETRRELAGAGAGEELLRAIDENLRLSPDTTPAGDYRDLLAQADYMYTEKKNPGGAVRFLNAAVKAKPDEAGAYEMLGRISLYDLNDPVRAAEYMKASVARGGSAVLRVYHDDSGDFRHRCAGRLHISAQNIRYESDDGRHRFETPAWSVSRVRFDTESAGDWHKHPVFKIYLRIGDSRTKFRFAPVSGKKSESTLAAGLILEAKIS